MKKTILTTLLLLLISGISWGQGKETFDSHLYTGGSETNGFFTGQDGSTWTYEKGRGDIEINGKAFSLGGESNNSGIDFFLKSGSITGGIGELRFTYKQTFWSPVELGIYVYDASDVQVYSTTVASSHGQNVVKISDTFQVGFAGDFKIEIRNIKSQYGQVTFDDIEWSAYSETLPLNSIITASPTSLTSLNYYEGDGSSAEQSFTVSGFDLGADISIDNPANSPFEISTATGAGFVANNAIVLAKTGRKVANTNLFVRLKSGLATGNYSETLTITSGSADAVNISLAGLVLAQPNRLETFDNFNSSTNSFTGQDGSAWTHERTRDDVIINGKALTLNSINNGVKGSLKSGIIPAGIGELRFSYKQVNNVSINLEINVYDASESLVKSISYNPSSGENLNRISDTFQIGHKGEFSLEFINTNGTSGQIALDDIKWSGYSKSLPIAPPYILVNPASLSDFQVESNETSAIKLINVRGNYLVDGISIATQASSAFEISQTTGSGFSASNPIVLAETSGKVTNTAIYVRLKAGLAVGNYSEVLTITSTNATTVEIPLSGIVKGAADQLVFKQLPSVGYKNISIGYFTVTAQRSIDNSTDENYTKNITISKVSGTGAIDGLLTIPARSGVATFSSVKFDTDGEYTIQATDGTLTSAASSTITLNSPHVLENFDNSRLTEDFSDDSFVGNNGFTWSYIAAMDFEEAFYGAYIIGNAILLSSAADNSAISSSAVPGGISDFSVKLYKGSLATDSGNRQLELFVNGVSKGTSTPFNNIKNEYIFAVDNINVTGDVLIELRNITPYPVIIDDISWNGYDNNFNLIVNGNEGWRILSSPTSDNSYQDLLGNIWTQGFTGAKTTGGDASVQTFNTSINSFTPINIAANMSPGQGFITYVYKDDDHAKPGAGSFPKTLSISGTKNTGTIVPTLNTGAETWTLVGNPYPSIIDWNLLGKTELAGVVYTYDPSISNYINYNGTAGGLTGGKIAPFQGFWVQNSDTATAPALQFTEAAKSVSGGQFYKQSTQSASFRMIAQMDGFANDVYFSFTNEGKIGKDNYDGLKLEPLDYADYLSLGTEVEGVLMDINNLPWDIKESVEFPVEINSYTKLDDGYAVKGGEVTLSLADLKNIPAEWGIVFNNYNTGETIDLRTQESYTFQLAAKAKMVKAKTAFSVLSPAGITREKSMGSSGFSITIQPDKTPVNLEPKDEPRVFALEQNYPNPFNPTTTIKYSVAETGAVSLAVYNIMGQKVADLVNSTKQAGNYAISWQAQDMASGLYFYRLSAAGQTITRQMTLIK